jgi:hypothetical protein
MQVETYKRKLNKTKFAIVLYSIILFIIEWVNMTDKSPIIDKPAKGTKYVHASEHRDSPNALSSTLYRLAEQVTAIGPIQVSIGFLSPRVSSESNRVQVTLEFFDYSKQDKKDISENKRELMDSNISETGISILKECVNRISVRLPKGNDQDNLALLLKKTSHELLNLGDIEVLDLKIYPDMQSNGLDRPCIVVYYLSKNN